MHRNPVLGNNGLGDTENKPRGLLFQGRLSSFKAMGTSGRKKMEVQEPCMHNAAFALTCFDWSLEIKGSPEIDDALVVCSRSQQTQDRLTVLAVTAPRFRPKRMQG